MTINSTSSYFILEKFVIFLEIWKLFQLCVMLLTGDIYFGFTLWYWSLAIQALMMKKLSYNDYSKRINTRDNGNFQSQYQKESKLNSTITK